MMMHEGQKLLSPSTWLLLDDYLVITCTLTCPLLAPLLVPKLRSVSEFGAFLVHFFGHKKTSQVCFSMTCEVCLADRTRLELATPCVTGMYSNQTELPIRLSE